MCPLTASKCFPHSLPWCIRTKWRVRGGKAKENCSLNSRIKRSHLNHPAKNHEPARADTHTALIVSHCWTTRTISPVYKKLLLNKLGWGHRNLRIFKTVDGKGGTCKNWLQDWLSDTGCLPSAAECAWARTLLRQAKKLVWKESISWAHLQYWGVYTSWRCLGIHLSYLYTNHCKRRLNRLTYFSVSE